MADNLPALLEAQKENILRRFPKLNDWLTPEIFWSVCESLRNDRRLAKAAEQNPNSVVTALMDLASWGLLPDGKEAFINSYEITQDDGKKLMTAQAQWIWQGGIRRAVDSGVIAHAVADIIRTGDSIEEVMDEKGRRLSHKRDIGKPNRPVIGAYALFWLRNGLMDYELCDVEDIERAKAASLRQSRTLKDTWKYAYTEMAKKTAIRRGLKRMVGRRDPSFVKMIETETQFDADVTASGELSDDEIPRAKESPEPEFHTKERTDIENLGDSQPAPAVSHLDLVVDADFAEVGEVDRVLTADEVAMVTAEYKLAVASNKERATALTKAIRAAIPGFTKLEAMRLSQVDAFMKALA